MPTRDEILQRLRPIIVRIIGGSPDRIKPETKFIEDLDVASLDLVEMVMEIEKAFDIEIPEESIDQILKVDDAITFIEQRGR